MAKFRKVHTAFWDDPLIEKLSPDARYFYLFLMTNPLCTECGIYQITVKKMCNYTGYNEDTIKSLIRVFEVDNCRIVYSLDTEEMCLLKKPNYIENTGKPVIDCLMAEFLNVKNKNLILRQILHIDKQQVKKIYDAYHASSYGTSKKLGQEEEKEKEEEKERGVGGTSIKPKTGYKIDLTETDVKKAIEYLTFTKNVIATKEIVLAIWGAFKIKNFTGEKFYKTDRDIIRHFFESLKFERLDGKLPNTAIGKTIEFDRP